MKIYLDNAATTFPKPPEVYTSMMNYMMNIGTNPGRGVSTASLAGNRVVLNCRYALMDFFHFDKSRECNFYTEYYYFIKYTYKILYKKGVACNNFYNGS